MQAALQEKEVDETQQAMRASEETLLAVHATLEGILKDTFKVEDGSRLSSLQSY